MNQAYPKDPERGESIEEKFAQLGDTDAATYTKIGAFVCGVIAWHSDARELIVNAGYAAPGVFVQWRAIGHSSSNS